MKNLLILVSIFIIGCGNQKDKASKTILIGTVVDRTSDTLLILKATEDARFQGAKIPINAGTFIYELEVEDIEEYKLIFLDEFNNGAWRPMFFFPDASKIEFKLHSVEKFDENRILGSLLTDKKISFEKLINEKYQSVLLPLVQESYQPKTYLRTSPKQSRKIDSIKLEIFSDKIEFILNDQSLYSYSLLANLVDRKQEYVSIIFRNSIDESYKILSKKYPYHVYTKKVENLLMRLNAGVGNNYIDFQLFDKNGEEYQLSSFIENNKFVLLDLWAPWCWPCIEKSEELIPHYENFRNMGLEVVAVVGRINSEDRFQKAITNHPYPWITLKDINNEDKVWEKYGIQNAGGSQFLINNSGEIISINPTIEEIEVFLTKET